MKSLIKTLSETIYSKTTPYLLESNAALHNPLERGEEITDKITDNHYLNDTPDEGWEDFWERWSSLSDEEFNTEFGKSKKDYKTQFENEVRNAKKKAVAYYKDYYSDKNPDVINKFKKGGFFFLPADILKILHKRLDKIAASDKKHEIYYSDKGMKLANPISGLQGSLKHAWGFAKPWSNKVYINLHNFSNPDVSGWKDNLFHVMVHELGHVISFILFKRGKKAYKKIKVDKLFDKKDKKGAEDKYVMANVENFARMQQLRRVFDVTTNLSAEEWVDLWMEAVNNGNIKFVYKVGVVKEVEKAPDGFTYEEWKKLWGEKFCAPHLEDSVYEKILTSENPKWYDQGKQVTIEISEDYTRECVCKKGYANCDDVANFKYKNRQNLWALYQKLEYFGQDLTDVGALLARFTSKYSKKGGNHYITIDFSKIAQANEEWATQDQQIGDEDMDSALV